MARLRHSIMLGATKAEMANPHILPASGLLGSCHSSVMAKAMAGCLHVWKKNVQCLLAARAQAASNQSCTAFCWLLLQQVMHGMQLTCIGEFLLAPCPTSHAARLAKLCASICASRKEAVGWGDLGGDSFRTTAALRAPRGS